MRRPRTYVAAALDEIARRRLRRARRAAGLTYLNDRLSARVVPLIRESEDVEGYKGRP